jgi:3',5'-cyclic AMP phosphodiesterase CpdA
MKILHLSDTHFHHEDMTNSPVLRRVNAVRKQFPNHLKIITGDVTDDGRDDQREKARKALDDTYLVLPGNHDQGTLGSAYDPARAKAFDNFTGNFGEKSDFFNKTPLVIKRENILIILLNSCLETLDPFDFACGEIGGRQTVRLKAILDDPAHQKMVKLVAVHHHPFIHNDPHMQMLDTDRFLRLLYGRVDILMFGHLHEEGEWHNKVGIPLVLAAESLYDSDGCKEITIDGGCFSVKRLKLEGCDEDQNHLNFRNGLVSTECLCTVDQVGPTGLH